MKIAIAYRNDRYIWGLVSNGSKGDVVVDVSDDKLDLWQAIEEAHGRVQDQLRRIDNDFIAENYPPSKE